MKHFGTLAILVIAVLFSINSCTKNFDINKKGGVRIVAEVSPTDFLRSLSDNCQDQTFNTALDLAQKKHWENDGDIFTLFEETLQEISPETKLAPYFLYEMKDCIEINSSNEEVLKAIRSEYDWATNNSQMIIQARLDQFSSLKRFNVKAMETPGRILVEFVPNKNFEIGQIRKLIQSGGNLEFWETYSLDEIFSYFDQANAALAHSDRNAAAETQDDPLFALLNDPGYGNSACIGLALVKDTAAINSMLAETKELFPRNLKPTWTAHPAKYGDNEFLELVALKSSYDNKGAMDGSTIIDAKQTKNQIQMAEVQIQMNAEGAKMWKRFTGDNIGRQIAIVLDGNVVSYPVVNSEIPNGRCSICGYLSDEEAKDLAIILKTGNYPYCVRIVEETMVEPEKGR